jgi:hypothetical protein
VDERLATSQDGPSSVVLTFLLVIYTFDNCKVIALFDEQQIVSK